MKILVRNFCCGAENKKIRIECIIKFFSLFLELSGDSEEEDVLVLEAGDIENPKRIQAKKNSSPTRQGNKAGQSSNRGNFQHSNNKNNNQRSNPNQGKRNRKKKKK